MKREECSILIMDTTMRIASEKTIAGLSMRQITAKSGVNPAIIYRYFGSKDKLLAKCYELESKALSTIFIHSMLEAGFSSVSRTSLFPYTDEELKRLWDAALPRLIKEDYRIIYYCEYSIRNNTKNVWMNNRHLRYSILSVRSNRLDFVKMAATEYARRVVKHNAPDNRENRNLAWKLLVGEPYNL